MLNTAIELAIAASGVGLAEQHPVGIFVIRLRHVRRDQLEDVRIGHVHTRQLRHLFPDVFRLIFIVSTREAIHLEWDADTLAERNGHKQLSDDLPDDMRHRSRVIDQHNHAVRLSISKIRNLAEQMVVVLVLVQLVYIQRTFRRDTSTCRTKCCLPHLEFLDHNHHGLLCFCVEVNVVFSRKGDRVGTVVSTTSPNFVIRRDRCHRSCFVRTFHVKRARTKVDGVDKLVLVVIAEDLICDRHLSVGTVIRCSRCYRSSSFIAFFRGRHTTG